MARLIETLSSIIEEEIQPGIRDSLPGLDPLHEDIYNTYIGVEPASTLGRDWKAIHTFSESISGAFKWVNVLGPTATRTAQNSAGSGGTPGHSIVPTDRSYPGYDESVLPDHLQTTIPLKQGKGNLFLPMQYLRLENHPAAVGSAVSEVIAGVSKNIALAHLAAFYAMDVSQALAYVGGNFSNNSTAGVTFTVYGPSVRLLHSGQHVDIYDTTLATKRNTGRVVVDGVRYIPATGDTKGYGAVTLRDKSGTAMTLVAGDKVMVADSLESAALGSFGPTGPEQWLINTGTIFGVDVGVHQQFQSILHAAAGSSLTELLLNQLWGRFTKGYGIADCPDTLITSQGVTTNYVDNSQGSSGIPIMRRHRDQGSRYTFSEGYEVGTTPFVFNGKGIMWRTSDFMPSLSEFGDTLTGGRMWGLKLKDQNIKRYTMPPIAGTRGESAIGREVEFFLGNLGPMSIFKPYHSTTGKTTDVIEAPFDTFTEYAPKTMQGILATGLLETL